MSKSTETEATVEASTELTALSAEEQALINANQTDANPDEFVIPILKVTQPLTNEVTSGEVRPGQFFLPLTGEDFGDEIEFVVAGKSKGRFRPGQKKGERTLVANDTNIVPWKDDPFYGQPFSEHPEAEEVWARRTNNGEQQWGKGPPIQTTMNYTGFIVGSDVPVRLSVRQTNKHAKGETRKWATLLDAVLRGRYWDKVFVLRVSQEANDNGQTFFVARVSQGRATTAEERQSAVQLATVLRSQNVRTVGDETEDRPAVAPTVTGGIEV